MVPGIQDDGPIGEGRDRAYHHSHDLRRFAYRVGEDEPEMGVGVRKLTKEERATSAEDVHSRKELPGLRFCL